MYHLSASLQSQLLQLPESGMGYQVIEILTERRERAQAIAFNAELVLPDTREHLALLQKHQSFAFAKGSVVEVREIVRVLPRSASAGWQGLMLLEQRGAYGVRTTGPAKDASKEKTKADELFRRFCAFANDRRVTADGRLTPGTYATTYADSEQVRTGKEAVARYALPNPDPAVHRFTIMPLAGTTIQYGIVEPANGQPGGGEEVIFADGTNPHSVIGRDQIPPG